MSNKTKALDALKTKFSGIDEKVLSRIATKIAKTAESEEDVLAKVEDMTIQGVIDSYTDSRVSDASEKAVKTYEEKYGLKEGKRAGANAGEGDPKSEGDHAGEGEEIPSWAKALMESNKALTEELGRMKAGKTAEDRKATVTKLLENAPDKVKKSILREFGHSQFENDDAFNSWIDEITPDIKEASAQETANRGVVGSPKGGATGGNKAINPFVQARIDARAKAVTATPAVQGLSK